MIIIATYLAQLKQLTHEEALIKFEKGLNLIRRLENIGQKKNSIQGPGIGIDEVFSPRRKETFSVTPEPHGGHYTVSGGLYSPFVWLHVDGTLKLYGPFWEKPQTQLKKLASRELLSYARMAVDSVDSSGSTGWELSQIPSMYKTGKDVSEHPFVSYSIVRKTNGVQWGPSPWGQVSLLDYSGEVYGIRLNREFKGVESFTGAMSPEAGEAYAARALLTLKNCDQVSLLKSGTKMITGNAMLGGTYYTATPRVRKIAAESIGVLAYEYTFGNDDFSLNGKHSVIHEVIIDAKSGDALRIQTPMPLGAPSPSKTPSIPMPTGKIQLVVGGHKMGQARLKIVANPKNVHWKDTVVQLDKRYLDAKWDGKSVLLINNQQYSISKVR